MARSFRWTAAIAAASVTFAVLAPSSVEAASHWRTDYQQARADAQRDGKLLLLHFHASWCGPCRKMDREVLSSPQLAQALGDDIIAVKIDSDQHGQLVSQLRIQALPSDVFMTPDGKVLWRTSGYQAAATYLQNVSTMAARHVRSRPVVAEKPTEPATPERTQERLPQRDRVARVEPSIEEPETESYAVADEDPAALIDDADGPLVGLDGFCPVTLWQSREWKRGNPDYAATYKGLTFHMVSARALEEFRSDPRRFAPRLLGCDPVLLSELNQAMPGSVSYGAFYDGELYLFRSADTRRRFKSDPLHYSKTRYVKRDELRRRRS